MFLPNTILSLSDHHFFNVSGVFGAKWHTLSGLTPQITASDCVNIQEYTRVDLKPAFDALRQTHWSLQAKQSRRNALS